MPGFADRTIIIKSDGGPISFAGVGLVVLNLAFWGEPDLWDAVIHNLSMETHY